MMDPKSNVITFSSPKPQLGMVESSQDPIGAIEKKMRAVIAGLRDTKYPDTFDWATYDTIAARYGDDQPRGGVVFNTTLKLVNHHSSCRKCHYAFEVDTYGRGCIHNCIYCYAKDQLSSHGYWNRPMPFPVNLADIRKTFYTVFETSLKSKWREVLEQRIPLRIGSMSDSFMWIDRKYGVTKELLKILSFYDYPYVIFTRSDLVATDEYLKLLRKDLTSVQLSVSGGNERITKLIEPGAPSVERRLATLKKLNAEGLWTTVRLNPFFPIYPDGFFTDPESIRQRFGTKEACPKFEMFDWSFMDQLKDANVPSLLVGFVRLSSWAINNLTKETGLDFKSFFKPELLAQRGDKRYSDSEISFYYKRLQQESLKRGIRFNTCYIGNGEKDYYSYQDLWTNKVDCCDARGNVEKFSSSSQDISWEIRARQSSSREAAINSQNEEKAIELQFRPGAVLAKSP
jgi:DNA repair photolyase